MTLVGMALSPASIMSGIHFERGRRAETFNQFEIAVNEYERVVERYPDSSWVIARLGIAQFNLGNLVEAITQFRKLQGRELNQELTHEVNDVIRQIEELARSIKADSGDPSQ